MAELNVAPFGDRDPNLRTVIDHFLHLISKATQYQDRLTRFPGTMPMTLSRRNLDMVSHSDYVCLEKSDGTRYMLFAISTHVFLIDRRMKVYAIEPNPEILSQGLKARQDNTILDGELTYNLITNQYEYLIYDVVIIDGDMTCAKMGFRERMQAAETFVAAPRVWSPFCAGLLRIRIKDFYERNQIRKLFDCIRKDPTSKYVYLNNNRRDGPLCNENDGVIFVPAQLGYQLKNSDTLLKWKPSHLNSVDFQLQLSPSTDRRRNEPSVRVTVAYKGDGNGVIPLREVYVPSKTRKLWATNLDEYNNTIAEFAYDRTRGQWCYMRQRVDKEVPNFSTTIINTLETIAEGIEREELAHKMEKTVYAPENQRAFVEVNNNNVAACTFRDDLFGERNPEYMATTPISMTPPPFLKPPPGMDLRRARGGPRRDSQRVANGEPSRRRESAPAEGSQQARAPFVYNEDV